MSTSIENFLITGGLIVATVFLLRSMLGHLRKVRTPSADAGDDPTAKHDLDTSVTDQVPTLTESPQASKGSSRKASPPHPS